MLTKRLTKNERKEQDEFRKTDKRYQEYMWRRTKSPNQLYKLLANTLYGILDNEDYAKLPLDDARIGKISCDNGFENYCPLYVTDGDLISIRIESLKDKLTDHPCIMPNLMALSELDQVCEDDYIERSDGMLEEEASFAKYCCCLKHKVMVYILREISGMRSRVNRRALTETVFYDGRTYDEANVYENVLEDTTAWIKAGGQTYQRFAQDKRTKITREGGKIPEELLKHKTGKDAFDAILKTLVTEEPINDSLTDLKINEPIIEEGDKLSDIEMDTKITHDIEEQPTTESVLPIVTEPILMLPSDDELNTKNKPFKNVLIEYCQITGMISPVESKPFSSVILSDGKQIGLTHEITVTWNNYSVKAIGQRISEAKLKAYSELAREIRHKDPCLYARLFIDNRNPPNDAHVKLIHNMLVEGVTNTVVVLTEGKMPKTFYFDPKILEQRFEKPIQDITLSDFFAS